MLSAAKNLAICWHPRPFAPAGPECTLVQDLCVPGVPWLTGTRGIMRLICLALPGVLNTRMHIYTQFGEEDG